MLLRKSTYAFIILINALFKYVNGQNEESNVEHEPMDEYSQRALDNFTELSGSYGYTSEEHTVVTDDGYILSLFRIPKGKKCQGPVRQPPVLLMHGLLQSSDAWLDAGPSTGLAFLISDSCYDLWAGNVRGTYYGRRHVRLDPDRDSKFWGFSTEEMGTMDLPATIDYILRYTGSNQINYVGFSQGARIFYIMCSETSGNCEKVKVFINLAPACRTFYSRSISVRALTQFYAVILPVLTTPRELEVLPRGGLTETALFDVCQNNIFASTICRFILYVIDSVHPGSFSTQTIRVLYGHFPAGTSARTAAIYGQTSVAGRFQKYSFGPSRNLELYGSIQPPTYNLNLTNIPVVIIYGKNDFLADPRDVKWLADQLPNVVELYQVKNPLWTHFDNCYSQSTSRSILPKISEYLRKYSQD